MACVSAGNREIALGLAVKTQGVHEVWSPLVVPREALDEEDGLDSLPGGKKI